MKRRCIFFPLALIAAGIATSAGAFAQSPEFEVAVIKPSDPKPPIMGIGPGLRNGTFHAQQMTLRTMIAAAYGMMEPQVLGPAWLDENRFDFAAKAPQGVPDSEMRPMLQALLKDRFQLAAHIEKREMPVYYLEVAKGGLKMQSASAAAGTQARPRNARVKAAAMHGTSTVARMASNFSRVVQRPVIDRTGLTERYRYDLTYAPPFADGRGMEFSAPDFFTAIQQQLGLKLEPGRDQVDVLVVDHADQTPTEN